MGEDGGDADKREGDTGWWRWGEKDDSANGREGDGGVDGMASRARGLSPPAPPVPGTHCSPPLASPARWRARTPFSFTFFGAALSPLFSFLSPVKDILILNSFKVINNYVDIILNDILSFNGVARCHFSASGGAQLGAKDAEPAVALRCGCRRVVGHRRKTQPPTHHTAQYSAVTVL